MGPQRLAVAEQEIKAAVPRNLRHQLSQRQGQLIDTGHAGVGLGQLLQQPAKCQLAVGAAHRVEIAVQRRRIVFQVAIVCKHPVATPQLAHKGVAVFQVDCAHRGLADMGHHVVAFDRVASQHLRDRRGGRSLFVYKVAHAPARVAAIALKEGDTPAVGMVVGTAAALGKTREAQGQAGGQSAVHPKQLAHSRSVRCWCRAGG